MSDPQAGDKVVHEDKFPPIPRGSLPILVIPQADSAQSPIQIRQSMAIINLVDELCDAVELGFPKSTYLMRGSTIIERAYTSEVLALAEELLYDWNSVQLFGSKAGVFPDVLAAKESVKWFRRPLFAIETLWEARGGQPELAEDGSGRVRIADIVLYHFLEFAHLCYGKALTQMPDRQSLDTYGGKQVETSARLRQFYGRFSKRPSARLDGDKGDVASDAFLRAMHAWHPGVWEEQ